MSLCVEKVINEAVNWWKRWRWCDTFSRWLF